MNGYVALGIAIVTEIFGTSMLKMSDGFSKLFPSIGVAVGFLLAFYFLSVSLKSVPLSLAYALWSGIGTVITAIIGILAWGDPFNMISFAGIALIIGGVVLLNYSKAPERASHG